MQQQQSLSSFNSKDFYQEVKGQQDNSGLDQVYTKTTQQCNKLIEAAQNIQNKIGTGWQQKNQNYETLLQTTKPLRLLQLSFGFLAFILKKEPIIDYEDVSEIYDDETIKDKSIKFVIEQARRLKLLNDNPFTRESCREFYLQLVRQKKVARNQVMETFNAWFQDHPAITAGKGVKIIAIRDIEFAPFNTVETARNTNFIVTVVINEEEEYEMFMGVSDNGLRPYLACARYLTELRSLQHQLNDMVQVKDAQTIAKITTELQDIERQVSNVNCADPADTAQKVMSLPIMPKEFRPEHLYTGYFVDWGVTICLTSSLCQLPGYSEIAKLETFDPCVKKQEALVLAQQLKTEVADLFQQDLEQYKKGQVIQQLKERFRPLEEQFNKQLQSVSFKYTNIQGNFSGTNELIKNTCEFMLGAFNRYIEALGQNQDPTTVILLEKGPPEDTFYYTKLLRAKIQEFKDLMERELQLIAESSKQRGKCQDAANIDDIDSLYQKTLTEFNVLSMDLLISCRNDFILLIVAIISHLNAKNNILRNINLIDPSFTNVIAVQKRMREYAEAFNTQYNNLNLSDEQQTFLQFLVNFYTLLIGNQVTSFSEILEKHFFTYEVEQKYGGGGFRFSAYHYQIMNPAWTILQELSTHYRAYQQTLVKIDELYIAECALHEKGVFQINHIAEWFGIEILSDDNWDRNKWRQFLRFFFPSLITLDLKPDNVGKVVDNANLRMVIFDVNIPTTDSILGNEFIQALQNDIKKLKDIIQGSSDSNPILAIRYYYKMKVAIVQTIRQAASRFLSFAAVIGNNNCYTAMVALLVEQIETLKEKDQEQYQVFMQLVIEVIGNTKMDMEQYITSQNELWQNREPILQQTFKAIEPTVRLFIEWLDQFKNVIALSIGQQIQVSPFNITLK